MSAPAQASLPASGGSPLRCPQCARLGLVALLFAVAALGWWWTGDRMRGMDNGPWTGLGSFGWFLGVWVVMMAAMMFPSVAPTVALYSRMTRQRSPLSPLLFTAGYLLTWAVAGIVAFGIGVALNSISWGLGGGGVSAQMGSVRSCARSSTASKPALRRVQCAAPVVPADEPNPPCHPASCGSSGALGRRSGCTTSARGSSTSSAGRRAPRASTSGGGAQGEARAVQRLVAGDQRADRPHRGGDDPPDRHLRPSRRRTLGATGRVSLAGDAAHAMTFNMGQGACQGIEDTAVLTRAMSRTRCDAGGAARLRGRPQGAPRPVHESLRPGVEPERDGKPARLAAAQPRPPRRVQARLEGEEALKIEVWRPWPSRTAAAGSCSPRSAAAST